MYINTSLKCLILVARWLREKTLTPARTCFHLLLVFLFFPTFKNRQNSQRFIQHNYISFTSEEFEISSVCTRHWLKHPSSLQIISVGFFFVFMLTFVNKMNATHFYITYPAIVFRKRARTSTQRALTSTDELGAISKNILRGITFGIWGLTLLLFLSSSLARKLFPGNFLFFC